ncbi:MAG: MerR family transcriptional regulator [Spirochaetes bacterium]|nr:MerR family transcriptional regulator [Spirochaetota bacterium]
MKKPQGGYRIGDLASMFGLTARTVRYYEELGLLKSSDRNEGIHRRYPARNLSSLKRIKNLKALGLSLMEIKEFFDLAERDPSGGLCKALLVRKYDEMMDQERNAMEEARHRLEELSARAERVKETAPFLNCPGSDCEDCPAADYCQDGIESAAKAGRP